MRVLIVLLLAFLTGCTTTIENLDGLISPSLYKQSYNKTVSAMKAHYFTPGAQLVIKDIPCVDGYSYGGGAYVVGVNFWSTLAGILTGSGYSRKCVIGKASLKSLGTESILHEYIHHLDDIGRDGDETLIDLREFVDAYILMATDHKWAGLVHYTEARANAWYTNWFGIGELSEHIAYVGGRMAASGKGPDYMWRVFRKVLVKHE